MPEPAVSRERPQTRGEEIANTVSHGLGLFAVLLLLPVVLRGAIERGDVAGVVGASVFVVTTLLVYVASTLYHAAPMSRAKHALRVLDQAAIFLMIAGTYTPFTLGVLRGPWGWTLFGLVWTIALAGVVLKALRGVRHPRISLALYLTAGWLVVIAAGPAMHLIPTWGILWLAAGGVAYTLGVAFFVTDHRIPYFHTLWHVCVLAGTGCHVIAVMRFAGG